MKIPSRMVVTFAVMLIIAFALACTKEVVKEIEVPGETVVVKEEVIKEVPGKTVVVEKEVIKEVEVPGKTVVVEKEVIKEVIVEKVVITEIMVAAPADPTVGAVSPPTWVWDGPTPASYNEAPVLAALVRQRQLPPVAERLPDEPLVQRVGERIGEYGGTLRLVRSCADMGGAWMISDPVVRRDINGDFAVPSIAKSWDASPDWKTWTFHLRRGMKWSDGSPFTANDFVWAVDEVARNTELFPDKRLGKLGTAGAGSYGGLNGVGDIELVDDYTFRYKLVNPEPNFPRELASISYWGYQRAMWGGGYAVYLPSAYLKQFHPKFADAAELDRKIADGGFDDWTGLFRKKSSTANIDSPALTSHVIVDDTPGATVYERNPYYFAVDPEGNQLPYIDTIAYSCGENQESIDLKVVAGQADFHFRGNWGTYPIFVREANRSNYRIHFAPDNFFYAIGPNQSYDGDPEIQRLIRSKDFRVALALSIDKQEFLDTYISGFGKVSNYTFMEDSPYYEKMIPWNNLYAIQDVDQANALLDGLGLAGRDADGYRTRSDGKGTLELTMSGATGPITTSDMQEAVVQYFREVGLKVTYQDVAATLATYLASNEAHMIGILVTFGGPVAPTPDYHWAPEFNTWAQSGGTAGVKPTDPKILKLYELGDLAYRSSNPTRGVYFQEMYKILAEEQYLISMFTGTPNHSGFHILKNNLRNIPPAGQVNIQQALYYVTSTRPEQWFFEGGANDAGY
jgi:peptide/nickel transport system substrate-binding protein